VRLNHLMTLAALRPHGRLTRLRSREQQRLPRRRQAPSAFPAFV